MKVLLVGPYPPPHGGVSVHVRNLHALLERSGVPCGVLNIERGAPQSDRYIRISGVLDFVKELVRHTTNDWMLHVHTNGHNPKSWLVALVCGCAAQAGPGCWLTLHSGMMPEFLSSCPAWRRTVARLACLMYERIVCVNDEIAASLAALGVPEGKLEIQPAYLPVASGEALPVNLDEWVARHQPVLSTAMFFRPEYGFELLVDAVIRLRTTFPRLGCIVMGSGEERAAAEALIEERGLRDVIHLAGDIDHELCLALMSRSDVFVRPSFRDGDSISVREAHALGIPVVASNVGTRPQGTLLFEPGDVEGLVERLLRVESPYRA